MAFLAEFSLKFTTVFTNANNHVSRSRVKNKNFQNSKFQFWHIIIDRGCLGYRIICEVENVFIRFCFCLRMFKRVRVRVRVL